MEIAYDRINKSTDVSNVVLKVNDKIIKDVELQFLLE